MSKLVFDAKDKYVHPTRYRQTVETASSKQLSSSAQSTISEDQKYNSVVARFTIKSSDRARWRAKHMNIWNGCIGKRDQS